MKWIPILYGPQSKTFWNEISAEIQGAIDYNERTIRHAIEVNSSGGIRIDPAYCCPFQLASKMLPRYLHSEGQQYKSICTEIEVAYEGESGVIGTGFAARSIIFAWVHYAVKFPSLPFNPSEIINYTNRYTSFDYTAPEITSMLARFSGAPGDTLSINNLNTRQIKEIIDLSYSYFRNHRMQDMSEKLPKEVIETIALIDVQKTFAESWISIRATSGITLNDRDLVIFSVYVDACCHSLWMDILDRELIDEVIDGIFVNESHPLLNKSKLILGKIHREIAKKLHLAQDPSWLYIARNAPSSLTGSSPLTLTDMIIDKNICWDSE